MKSKLRNALDSTSQGLSPDRVVADPELNAAFLAECVRLGLVGSPATLNRALLNLRKQGELRDRKSRKTSFANEDEYRFAAEMAVRFLERRDGLSLDAIICDPAMATEFDGLAAKILPGYTSLQYRWAALNLRKKKRLQPELLATVVRPLRVATWRVEGLDLNASPPRKVCTYFSRRRKRCTWVKVRTSAIGSRSILTIRTTKDWHAGCGITAPSICTWRFRFLNHPQRHGHVALWKWN
jgi:hypothetical protein